MLGMHFQFIRFENQYVVFIGLAWISASCGWSNWKLNKRVLSLGKQGDRMKVQVNACLKEIGFLCFELICFAGDV